MRLPLPVLLLTLVGCAPGNEEPRASSARTLEGRGFEYGTTAFRRTVWHHVRARLDDPRVGIRVTSPSDFGGATLPTSEAAARLGAAVAVNGNWFGGGCGGPCGLARGGGVPWSNPGAVEDDFYGFLAFTPDKRVHLNPVGVTEGLGPEWTDVVSGDPGLFILRDGVTLRACSGYEPSLASDFTARTAVGLSRDGREIFFAVAPMADPSGGAEFCDLGDFMRSLGAWNAVALDGGGSSALAIDGVRVTPWKYTEGHERPVPVHLMLMLDPDGRFGVPPSEPTTRLGPPLVAVSGPWGLDTASPRRVFDTRGRGALLTGTEAVGVGSAAPAALVNLTATAAQGVGYFTAFAGARPDTSSLNFGPGSDAAALALVPTGPGSFQLFSSAPSHALVDVVTTLSASGSRLEPRWPARAYDSRASVAFSPGELRRVGLPQAPADATSAWLNVTVAAPSEAGWVSVGDCSGAPSTSTLNFAAGETRANATVAALSGGAVCVYASTSVHVLVDVLAFGRPGTGGEVTLVQPARALDTRVGNARGEWRGMVAAGQELALTRSSWTGLPAEATAVIATVTSVDSLAPGFLSAAPCGAGSDASVLNFGGGAVANLVLLRTDALGRVCLRPSAPTHLLVDVVGFVR
ncbi:MAG: phosphodiester glycosidase family protein [Myxococcaceae bacterium]|nr:phosphodiester glycosidase family protein [Myxococcaceae bacterium]